MAFRQAEGLPRLGALHGPDDDVIDLAAADAGTGVFESIRSLMASEVRGLDMAHEVLYTAIREGRLTPRAEVQLLSPIGKPTLIRDFATMETHMRNYLMLRAVERSRTVVDPPAYIASERAAGRLDMPRNWLTVYQHHIGNPLNTMGPDDVLTRPVGVKELDYELELAAVVGQSARSVSVEEAAGHIFGYTLMNDFTARDIQRIEGKAAGKSKDFDGSYSIGPCIVTRDEFKRWPKVKLRSRLNGQLQAEDSTSSMRLSFEQLLSYISQSCTIHPGEILASGTFAMGCGYEVGRFLEDGDIVEIEADGIGTLRNQVRGHP
ncbi:fumarylacetoacetate hydrolase family protein [Hydrogenophaga sp.]|uniref:fumarylacetoacetate hydrolase family protein n=1 Tax=Hydrogenophaga sp. TaxID=1904254 RepID=UPI003D0EBB46